MKLWNNKTPPDAPQPDRLREIGAERVTAAKRLDAALVEVESAIEALLATNSRFFEEVRNSGQSDHGTAGNLRRVLRTLIVGQMQNATPQFIKVLGIPYQPMRTRGQIATAIERTNNNDLINLAAIPEQQGPAQ